MCTNLLLINNYLVYIMKKILVILLAFTALTVGANQNAAVAKKTCAELHQENDKLRAVISDIESKKASTSRKFGIK